MKISNLNDSYIYCGRGKGYELQAGNTRYRGIVKEQAVWYAKAPGRKNKAIFVQKILSRLQEEQLMFVKLKEQSLTDWQPLGPIDSRHKVAHSLRDAVAMINKQRRRQQQEQLSSPFEITQDDNSDWSLDTFATDESQSKETEPLANIFEDDGFESFLSSLVAQEAERMDYTALMDTTAPTKVTIGPKPVKFIPQDASECYKFLGSGKTDSYLRCLTIGCSGPDTTF